VASSPRAGAYDFTNHDLDAPFPDFTYLTVTGRRAGADVVLRPRRRNRLRSWAPETVADALHPWLETEATDTYNLHFRTTEDLENFVATVVPVSQRRGVFRTE
jgi:alkanesulfonate monooxygenase SsuD/methylene tetrahydromethanopterin reductase-like flavin-dependent oxidoreductase (luciferase family)